MAAPTLDFDRLVARHKDAVYRQMLRVCGNHADAEDALATALMNAFRASSDLRDPAAFQGWIAIIGRRACQRLRQSQARRPEISFEQLFEVSGIELSHPEDISEHAEMEETKRCVVAALAALPPIYREVYQLREIEQLEASEVAERLGLTVAAVKSRLHRARALVRQALDTALCEG